MVRQCFAMILVLLALAVPVQAGIIVEFQNTGKPLISSGLDAGANVDDYVGIVVKITPTAGETVGGFDFSRAVNPDWGIVVSGSGMSQRMNDPDSPDGDFNWTNKVITASQVNTGNNASNMDSHFLNTMPSYLAGVALSEVGFAFAPTNPMADSMNVGWGYGSAITGAIGFQTLPAAGASVPVAYIAMKATDTIRVLGQVADSSGAKTNVDVSMTPVPEPSTVALLLCGLVGACLWFRRR